MGTTDFFRPVPNLPPNSLYIPHNVSLSLLSFRFILDYTIRSRKKLRVFSNNNSIFHRKKCLFYEPFRPKLTREEVIYTPTGEFSRSRCSRNVRKTRGMQTDNRYDLRLFVVAPEKFPLDDGIFLVFSVLPSLSLFLQLRITEVRQAVGLSSARHLSGAAYK